jgi:hypothetical protein
MIYWVKIMKYLAAALVLMSMAAVGDLYAVAQSNEHVAQTNRPIVNMSQPIVNTRIPNWQIQEHISHDWLRDTITHGLMDYWVKNSVAPNGFIQEDMDRQWKHWGTQEEATINGQGRQLLSMALVYEMNEEKSKEYLDAITRATNFMLTKMHDPQYGGY